MQAEKAIASGQFLWIILNREYILVL